MVTDRKPTQYIFDIWYKLVLGQTGYLDILISGEIWIRISVLFIYSFTLISYIYYYNGNNIQSTLFEKVIKVLKYTRLTQI